MFKFTIEADTIEMLQTKMNHFAQLHAQENIDKKNKTLPQVAVDYLLTAAQGGVENNSDVEAVMESFQHAQSTTVPHINPGPSPVLNLIPDSQHQVTDRPGINKSDELDVKGLPYDARIHSAGKSKNQDGTWRYRRGVDPTLIEQVEKEISKLNSVSPLQSAPIPPVPPSPAPAMPQAPVYEPPVQQTPMAPPLIEPMQYQQVAPAPVSPPSMLAPPDQSQAAPAAPEVARHPDAPQWASPTVDKVYEAFTNVDKGIVIPPGQKPAHTLQTFQNNLTEVLAQLINEKKINKEYIESLCKHFNVKYIWNVIGSATQIRELYDAFGQYGFITKLD